jgi:hypothetical protein
VAHGAQVVGAARDLAKAERATNEVRAQAANGGGFELVELDLASLKSVRACADALVADGRPFDTLIANAGVMRTPFGHTADGFETQFGTNHLGHFGGRYCEDCQVSQVTEGLISPVSPGVRPYALDPEHAKALWARSEELVGERF